MPIDKTDLTYVFSDMEVFFIGEVCRIIIRDYERMLAEYDRLRAEEQTQIAPDNTNPEEE